MRAGRFRTAATSAREAPVPGPGLLLLEAVMPKPEKSPSGPRRPASSKPPLVKPVRSNGRVTDEEVARRAHALFLQRGGRHGGDVDDWLEAERQLNSESSSLPSRAGAKRTVRKKTTDREPES
jgi:Protein of unknown function (DUF2934)